MLSVVGIFSSQADAEIAAKKLNSLKTPYEDLLLLAPDKELEPEIEPDQYASPLRAKIVGACFGLTAALLLSMPAGPLLQILFGCAGALIGSILFNRLIAHMPARNNKEKEISYHDAITAQRSLVVAFTPTQARLQYLAELLKEMGAESIDYELGKVS